MRFLAITILCSLLYCPALAQTSEETAQSAARQYATKLIDSCWQLSEEDRNSGITSRMTEGTSNSTRCLRDEIEKLAFKILKSDADAHAFLKEIDSYRENSNAIYWAIFNTHKGCTPCGTMYEMMHLARTASAFEDILKAMVMQAYDFSLISSSP